jgi:Zn-dependent M28 family amino/carboxypeptidase
VIGWLPGTDRRLAPEMVVLSAHLDHLGDDVPPVVGSTDRIANGVFDNAIGVATMIETARRLVRAPGRQARGIVFVAFTAEEQGLLGSRWFVRHLPVMRRRQIANVNIDMPILSYPLADLLVRGADWTGLPCAARLERELGLPITQDFGTTPPSDNLNFVRIGVPTYLPLPGEAGEGLAATRQFRNEHYHRASDDLSLAINWASVDRYTTFVQLLTVGLANGCASERHNP